MQEQYIPQAFDQSSQRTGTTFERSHQGYIENNDIAQQEAELARADAHAALQAQEEPAKKSLEYVPLPQEVVRMMGIKVVFGMRKPHEERSIYLFNDESESTAPYIAKSWNTTEESQTPAQEDLFSKEDA